MILATAGHVTDTADIPASGTVDPANTTSTADIHPAVDTDDIPHRQSGVPDITIHVGLSLLRHPRPAVEADLTSVIDHPVAPATLPPATVVIGTIIIAVLVTHHHHVTQPGLAVPLQSQENWLAASGRVSTSTLINSFSLPTLHHLQFDHDTKNEVVSTKRAAKLQTWHHG